MRCVIVSFTTNCQSLIYTNTLSQKHASEIPTDRSSTVQEPSHAYVSSCGKYKKTCYKIYSEKDEIRIQISNIVVAFRPILI